MNRLLSCLTALVLCLSSLLAHPAPACAASSDFDLSAEIAVYSISGESRLRLCGETADLSALSSDEFYTYELTLRYTGSQAFSVETMTVSVDGGEPWGWAAHTLEPNSTYRYHVYYSNMQSRQTEGAHSVVWSVNGQAIYSKTFSLVRPTDWSDVFPIPSAPDIAAANASASVRSPYLYGWLDMDREYRFTEYSIDFKADFLPQATYCCLANMRMDLSSLEALYSNVHTEYEYFNMYAGFQRRWTDGASIISFWDIYYDDANGVRQTLRAQRLYPAETDGNDSFSGEGTGAHTLVPYAWEEDRWYRMLLQCSESADNGHTLVDQWVCDLETGEWTLLCRYDTGLTGSCFAGPAAFFLENFDSSYAGEVRTLEVANIRLCDAETGQWRAISSASLGSNGGLPKYEGSYAFGSSGSRFWMITSGVGGDWYNNGLAQKNNVSFSVQGTATGSPY